MRCLAISVAAITFLWLGVAWSAEPPAAELIVHWKLAGDGRDASNNGLHAENHGATFEPTRGAPHPVSAKFDGRGQFLSVPSAAALNLGTEDFSISLWMQTDEQLDDDIGDLISKFDPVSRTGFHLSVRNNTGVTSSLSNDRQLEFSIDQGSEPKWHDLGRPGGEQSILPFALASFRNRLFAGTCQPGKDTRGNVYALNAKHEWEQISVPHLANSVSSLAIFQDELYCGTSKYRVAGSALPESENTNPGGQIFRLAPDAKSWVACGQLPDTEAVGGMTVYKGKLYASSLYRPAGFFRYEGGEKWTSLPTPNGKRTESLGVYNGYLWATGYDEGHIYRFDGEQWVDMGVVGENTQTYSFAIHEGKLWIGTWPSGKVFRLNDQNQWEDMGRLGQELEVMGMLVYNGKLYAGTLPLAEVYRYDGGQTWTRLKQLDTANVKYRRAWTMAQHAGQLAVGVLPSGHVHSLETGVSAATGPRIEHGWRHIAAVKQGNVLRTYYDGRPYANSTEFSREMLNLSNSQPLRIGGGAGDTFRGHLSDVRIYRGGLSAEEISKLAIR